MSAWKGRQGLAALGVLLSMVVARAVLLGGSWFNQDDFYLSGRAYDADLTLGFLVRDTAGHVNPLQQLAYWLVAHAAPYSWATVAVFVLVLQTAATVVLWLLLTRLLGERWSRVVLLAVFAWAPLTLATTLWWSAAMGLWPHVLCSLLAVHLLVRWRQGDARPAWALAAIVATTAFGLLWHERAVLIAPVLYGVAVALADEATGWRRLWAALRRFRWLWVAQVLLLAGFLVGHCALRRRVMGTEVEYGISVQGVPTANPMVASSQVVNAYASATVRARRARWDFEEESPLRDARGFDMSRQVADPTQLTDEDLGLANVILTNGARLYVDHAHPEYSTPEVTTPLDIVRWDKAGEQIMLDAARRAGQLPGGPQIVLYKNNTDNKGASYGAHENYLMRRSTPFGDIVRHLTPFFVSRQVFCGAGRVGIGQDGREDGFQISQRADFFEVEVGLETTLKRPIINTRDEPHADPEKYRRLHVIIGDANLSEVATYLKVGTTALVLAMIEDRFISSDLTVDGSVAGLRAISHDPTLRQTVTLTDGRRLTGIQLQLEYLDLARKYVEDRYGADADAQTVDVLARWESVLDRLERDPMLCARELDWVAKLKLIEQYRQRDGLAWDDAKLQVIDYQYSDIRPEKGLYHRLVAAGRLERLLDDGAVETAMYDPPEETRAYFRGRCLEKYSDHVAAASWDSVIFDLPGRESLQRVPTIDPLRGSKAHVGDLLDRCETAEELFTALTR